MKIYRFFILWVVLFGCFQAVYAQEATGLVTDSITVDSPKVKTKLFAYNEDGYPIPKKAAIFSMALPGAGQVYNGRWWKLPFVAGAVGGIVYAIDFNQTQFRRFRTALSLELKDQPHEFSVSPDLDANTLRSLRDTYDRYTQQSYMGAILVYAVITVEAFVDAHLQNFDVDDDLSFRLKPSLQLNPLTGGPAPGIGLVIVIP